MPVARFLRLLLTLFVLVSGWSALRWSTPWASRGEPVVAQSPPAAVFSRIGASDRGQPSPGTANGNGSDRSRRARTDVGDSATPASSGVLRQASRGRAGLLSIFSRALAADGATDGNEAELEMADHPDLVDDDGPQGFIAGARSELWLPRLPAPYLEPDLWGIQPSIGHPRGDDEPPRI